ncbi:MAG: hypothetical protein ACTSVY_11705 [Candidatus Helarchaeota archaeon]
MNIEKYINYKSTTLELEQLIKNWISESNYELISFNNYEYKIKMNDSILILILKELMDSVTVILKGVRSTINELSTYLNSHLSETTSFVIEDNEYSNNESIPLNDDKLIRCPICGELQPEHLKFCLKCGAVLTKQI